MCHVEPPRRDLPAAKYFTLYREYVRAIHDCATLGCVTMRGYAGNGSPILCGKRKLGGVECKSGSVGSVDDRSSANCGVGSAATSPTLDSEGNGLDDSNRSADEGSRTTSGTCSGTNGGSAVSERTLANRRKRQRSRARKAAKKLAMASSKSIKNPERCAPVDVARRDTPGGFFSGCSDNTRDQLRESRARLLIAQNERRLVEEKRKFNKLNSPEQLIEDAMRQISFAEKCAKMANNSKVAAWAADLSSASAESIARSSGSYGKVETIVTEPSTASGAKPATVESKRGTAQSTSRGLSSMQRGILTGVDSVSGRSVQSDGTLYTYITARAWVGRYSHIKSLSSKGKTVKEMAAEGNISVMEVEKYFRLKKEFKL